MISDIVIIHHEGCSDGICAAMILRDFFLTLDGNRNIECIPASYGDIPPAPEKLNGRHVYIVDFSYSRGFLMDINMGARSLVVLDHHKTAKANCEGLPFCFFDETRCGAELAFAYVSTRETMGGYDLDTPFSLRLVDLPGKVPLIVEYVADRDLWKWELPFSKEINAWLASFRRSELVWSQLKDGLRDDFDTAVTEGTAILRNERMLTARIAARAVPCRIAVADGLTIMAVNTPILNSEVCHLLLESSNCDVACAWYMDGKGGVVHSLRSRAQGPDVSKIAQQYRGGGGHENAAGFTTQTIEVICCS
jgi:oligoribonuclease NrnB/cAMP/cGMP phosphodiesterase (DHH superfamily)